MKHLIVYCHPNPKSYNNAIKDIFIEVLEEKGHEVEVRDLYAMDFDPILKVSDFMALQSGTMPADILAEQEKIKWAEVITIICPIWWMDFPARMHGYIDRVFLPGFAYTVEEDGPRGLLGGKKVFIINTTGGLFEQYKEMGFFESFKKTMDIGKFGFCALEVVGHKYLQGIPYISEEERKELLVEARRSAEGIA